MSPKGMHLSSKAYSEFTLGIQCTFVLNEKFSPQHIAEKFLYTLRYYLKHIWIFPPGFFSSGFFFLRFFFLRVFFPPGFFSSRFFSSEVFHSGGFFPAPMLSSLYIVFFGKKGSQGIFFRQYFILINQRRFSLSIIIIFSCHPKSGKQE